MLWIGILIGAIGMYIISYIIYSNDDITNKGDWYLPLTGYFYKPFEWIGELLSQIQFYIWLIPQFRATIFLHKHNCSWKHLFSTAMHLENEDKKKFVSLLICSKKRKQQMSKALKISTT